MVHYQYKEYQPEEATWALSQGANPNKAYFTLFLFDFQLSLEQSKQWASVSGNLI